METELANEDYCLFSNNSEVVNVSNVMEDWMDTDEKYINFEEDSLPNCFSLKTDPLLSQVQIDENSILATGSLESEESITVTDSSCTETILNTTKVKSQNVLTSHNKNKKTIDPSSNISSNDNKYKEDMLKERNIIALEMVYIRNGVGLFLKDSEMTQMFLTQHIKMTSLSAEPPVQHQFVKKIDFQQISDTTNVKLPQIVTNIGSKIYLCPVKDCTEAFLQLGLAKRHSLKHLHVRPYKCSYPECLWEFYTQCHLLRHQTIHEKRQSFVCNYENCNKEFTTAYNLSDHRKKAHIRPATKICVVFGCRKYFRTEKDLRLHCKTHCESEAPYVCTTEHCKKKFFTQSTFNTHFKTHQYDNTTVCHFPDCGKSFNTQYRLKEHIRIHTGTKPYKCKFEGCEWKFTTASRLRRHEKIHNAEEKFACTVEGCTKVYKRREKLREHCRNHVESSPGSNSCEICGLTYTSKPAHMKKFHTDLLKEDSTTIIEHLKNDNLNIPQTEELSMRSPIHSDDNLLNSNYENVAKSEEELLQEAIRSLGVPDLILDEEIMAPETLGVLESDDISTVNLKDLD